MPKCSYCGKNYPLQKGVTYVQNDGTIVYLCSSKCRKNRKMKRRNVIWAQYNKTVGTEESQAKGVSSTKSEEKK